MSTPTARAGERYPHYTRYGTTDVVPAWRGVRPAGQRKGPQDYERDGWHAICGCGWSGAHRSTKGAAQDDGAAHEQTMNDVDGEEA